MKENNQGKKILRLTILALAFILVLAMMIFSVNYKPTVKVEIWNQAMTKGSDDGKPYVMYTDIACPYCLKFAEAINSHKDEFNRDYIDNGKIRFEVRVTDYLYASGNVNSKSGGESAYCAANQDKFWPYYEALTHKLYNDYYSKDQSAPELYTKFFADIAENVGLNREKFVDCLDNHETEEKLDEATQKAQVAGVTGMPSFSFNGSTMASGFGGDWDMENNYKLAKQMIEAQL